MTRSKRFFLYPVAFGCLLIGAAGALLPVLPGWPFFFIGLSILAPRTAVRLRRRAHRALFKPETILLEDWRREHDVHAGYTTKRFPLVLKKSDEWLDLTNQKRFKDLFWKSHVLLERDKALEGRYVILNQVHGDGVVVLDDAKVCENEGFYHFPEADAVVTNIPRLTLLVLTADCLPIFLCGVKREGRQKNAEWIGLVHAGWRGTRLGIAGKAVRLLCERGGFRPEDVRASFGPSIGKKHYQVGEEFGGYFRPPSLRKKGRRYFFDLAGENRRQLLEAGLDPRMVSDPRLCTIAENRHFFSYRKEKEAAGRTISFIARL